MRVSDWSSDVCSSDLSAVRMKLSRGDVHRTHSSTSAGMSERSFFILVNWSGSAANAATPPAVDELVVSCPAVNIDGKSVGKGKRVSVRVVLSGRCILKKNRKQ